MNLELRARFAQLGPIRGIDRVPSGSPAAFVLRRPERLDGIRSIDAMLTLARRGISMLRAKRAIEELIAEPSRSDAANRRRRGGRHGGVGQSRDRSRYSDAKGGRCA